MCGKYNFFNFFLSNSGFCLQFYSQFSLGERKNKFSQNGKVHLGLNVSSSTLNCGCMVDGSNAI